MHTFFAIFRPVGRRSPTRSPIGPSTPSTIRPGACRRPPLPGRGSQHSFGSQDGFLLIEVMISALLVALVVVATFNGFDLVNRTDANQRDRSEAYLLAAESQEQLRSEPASALETLAEKGSSGHAYTSKVNG